MIEFRDTFKNTINKMLKADLNFYIAGGLIGSMNMNKQHDQDMDIYFRTSEDFEKALNFLKNNTGFKHVISTLNAETFNILDDSKSSKSSHFITAEEKSEVVQLVRKEFGEPEEVIANFDINKSMIAFDFNRIIKDPRFEEPLHILKYHSNTLKRICKYSLRYNVTPNFKKIFDFYLEDGVVPDYYNSATIQRSEVLKRSLKTLYDSKFKNEIIKVLDTYEITPQFIEIIRKIFIYQAETPDKYFLKIVYFLNINSMYSSNSLATSDSLAAPSNIMKKKKEISREIMSKNPEILLL